MVERPCVESCTDAMTYHPGIKGEYADKAKIMMILNKPDSRIMQASLFDNYKTALFETRTGSKIVEMLKYCNLSPDHVWITNIYKCVLPEDREPRKAEYRRCISVLEEQIRSFRPRKILACGNRVFEHLFEGQNGNKFEQTVGKVFKYNDQIPTLVMHHPSKKWMYSREKREGDYEKLKEFLRAGTITLCGSAKFFPKLWDIKKELEMYGFEVLTPSMVDFHHLLHTNRERFLQRQRAATKDHFDKIRRSDAIYVANYDNDGIAGRVGENSFMEISVAFYRGIPIFMMKPVPDMAYGDIIECMSPNIVGENWDLMSDSLRDILLYVTGLTDLEVESSQDI